jgi:hypothetical protein
MCLVKFETNQNAVMHFNGVNHRNKIITISRKNSNPDLIICPICICELNTLNALSIHEASPKHLKKEEALIEIKQLKEDYLKAISEKQQTT